MQYIIKRRIQAVSPQDDADKYMKDANWARDNIMQGIAILANECKESSKQGN